MSTYGLLIGSATLLVYIEVGLYMLISLWIAQFAIVTLQAQLSDWLARVNQAFAGSKQARPILDLCCTEIVARCCLDKQYRAELIKASRLLSKDLDLVEFIIQKKRIWMATSHCSIRSTALPSGISVSFKSRLSQAQIAQTVMKMKAQRWSMEFLRDKRIHSRAT